MRPRRPRCVLGLLLSMTMMVFPHVSCTRASTRACTVSSNLGSTRASTRSAHNCASSVPSERASTCIHLVAAVFLGQVASLRLRGGLGQEGAGWDASRDEVHDMFSKARPNSSWQVERVCARACVHTFVRLHAKACLQLIYTCMPAKSALSSRRKGRARSFSIS